MQAVEEKMFLFEFIIMDPAPVSCIFLKMVVMLHIHIRVVFIGIDISLREFFISNDLLMDGNRNGL